MFKKILFVLLGVLLTLLAILFVNTLRLSNTQIEPGTLVEVDWDRDLMLDRFSKAIQYKTISGDETDVRDTTEFHAFLEFIEVAYPLVHERLERVMFNNLTPLYFWEGSDTNLDPVLYMGHYDVVPVDSTDIDGWMYGPFSGEIADGYIWGRGTLDNKNNVMSLLETLEYLLTVDYQPRRSFYVSFGHDEEIGGEEGARAISRYFQDNDITLHYVLDEGGVVMLDNEMVGNKVAMVGIAEKGYLSLELTARTRGGHSSSPPNDMAILKLSEALLKLNENQFKAHIDGATERMFESIANKLPFQHRMVYGNRWATERLMTRMMASNPALAPLVRTTTAPTILRAGVKDNVLPTEARAVVNFRLLPGETFDSVREHVIRVINDEDITVRDYGPIQVPPSMVSPVQSPNYRILQQAIMDRFQDLYVMPYLVSGATDSRYFTGITDQIYRFSPVEFRMADMGIVHGTGERISVDSYTGSIDFYVHLIKMSTE